MDAMTKKAAAKARHVYGEPRQDWLDWLRGASILMVLTAHYQRDWHEAGIFKPLAAFFMRVCWSDVDMFSSSAASSSAGSCSPKPRNSADSTLRASIYAAS